MRALSSTALRICLKRRAKHCPQNTCTMKPTPYFQSQVCSEVTQAKLQLVFMLRTRQTELRPVSKCSTLWLQNGGMSKNTHHLLQETISISDLVHLGIGVYPIVVFIFSHFTLSQIHNSTLISNTKWDKNNYFSTSFALMTKTSVFRRHFPQEYLRIRRSHKKLPWGKRRTVKHILTITVSTTASHTS